MRARKQAMSTSEKSREELDLVRTVPSVDRVAAVVAGIPNIVEACRALRKAGWQSNVAGNRITVNNRVVIRYIEDAAVPVSHDSRWVVYGLGDCPIVRIVLTGDGTGA